ELLQLATLGTAHIAGYSLDGKANGVAQIHHALCKFLNQNHELNLESLLPTPQIPHLTLDSTKPTQQILHQALTAIYDIKRDDHALRQILNLPPEQRAQTFDHLRKIYPPRRESHSTRITLSPHHPEIADKLTLLNFPLNQ
ncbi:MAG: DUF3410 domain-containing protein, partial [Planctomycetes bacterium]|nr:DUF3410 domain-containing protein [Planctomycetota bacterium]